MNQPDVPNTKLRDTVTSAAFHLTLSARMTRLLLNLDEWERHVALYPWMPDAYPVRNGGWRMVDHGGTGGALARRGLIAIDDASDGYLTKAGKLAAELLREAGFLPARQYPVYPQPNAGPLLDSIDGRGGR